MKTNPTGAQWLFLVGGGALAYYLFRKWKPEPGMQVLGPGEAAQVASNGIKAELIAYSQATGTPLSRAAVAMHRDNIAKCEEVGWSTNRCVVLADFVRST